MAVIEYADVRESDYNDRKWLSLGDNYPVLNYTLNCFVQEMVLFFTKVLIIYMCI